LQVINNDTKETTFILGRGANVIPAHADS